MTKHGSVGSKKWAKNLNAAVSKKLTGKVGRGWKSKKRYAIGTASRGAYKR